MVRAIEGDLSLRQFRVMVEHLPPHGPVSRELTGQAWSELDSLLWDVSSQLRRLNTSYYNVNRGKNQPEHKYEPLFPHPEQKNSASAPKLGLTEEQKIQRADLQATLKRSQLHPN